MISLFRASAPIMIVELLFASCDRGSLEPSEAAVRDSLGIEIVELAEPATMLSPEFTAAASPTSVLGSLMGTDGHAFGSVDDAALLEGGAILVLDRRIVEVRWFESPSDTGRTVIHEGDGPGEMSFPSELHVLGEDTIVVGDLGHRSLMVYDPDFSYMRQTRLGALTIPAVRGSKRADTCCRSVGVLSNGVGVWRVPEEYRTDGAWHRGIVRVVLVAMDRTTTIAGPFEGSLYGPSEHGIEEGRSSQAILSSPLHIAQVGGTIVLGNGAEASLHFIDPSGALTRIVRWPWQPREVSRQDADSARNEMLQALGPDAPPAVLEFVRKGPVARTHLLFTNIVVDRSGRIWLELPGAGNLREYLVLDHEGRYLGRGRLPSGGKRVLDIYGRRVLIHRRGEFDEDYLEQWELGTHGETGG